MRRLKRSLALGMACLMLMQNYGVAVAQELPEQTLETVEEQDNNVDFDIPEDEISEFENIEAETANVEAEDVGDESDDDTDEDELLSTAEASGELTYTVKTTEGGEKVATITGYTGHFTNLTIYGEYDGATVTEIKEEAFLDKTELVSVTLPETMDTIGARAFKGCTSLSSITLPANLESLGANAFMNCSSLTSINIPKNTNVEATASTAPFVGCSSLNTVVFAEGITSIPAYMLARCESLVTVTIPSTVKYIGNYAFAGCTKLTGVVLPAGLRTIGASAFKGDVAITSIALPKNVTTTSDILYAPFEGTGITEATFDPEITTVPCNILAGCDKLTTVNIDSTFTKLTEIEDGAFRGCEKLTAITIPEKVTAIGVEAFKGCASITQIRLPDEFKTLGTSAFAGCAKLAKINIPKKMTISATDAGMGPFEGCASLKQKDTLGYEMITFADGITAIAPNLFAGCTGLDKFEVPSVMKTVGSKAFYKCTGLKEVVFTDETTSLGSNAFAECTELVKVNLPNKQTTTADTLEKAPYYGCSKLTTIVYDIDPDDDDDLLNIPSFMFAGVTGLVELNLLEVTTLNEIGMSAFMGCSNLKVARIPATVKAVGSGAFTNCSEELKIYCASGSVVEAYAKKNNIQTVVEQYVTSIKVRKKNTTTDLKTVSLYSNEEVELTSVVGPVNANNKTVAWSIEDTTIADFVGAPSDGVYKIKAKNAGCTTLKVSATDGSMVKAEIKLVVDPISPAARLSAKTKGVPKNGLPCGETANILIYANTSKEVLDPELFTYTVSDSKLAKVDKNGLITSLYPNSGTKTVTVTAALKNDSKNRKVSVNVNVIATPVYKIDVKLTDDKDSAIKPENVDSDGNILLSKAALTEKPLTFKVVATPFDEFDHSTATTDFSWSVSDNTIATIVPSGKYCEVTLKQGVDGAVAVNCTSKDTNKTVGSIYIYIRNSDPRLATTSVTLDTKSTNPAFIEIVEAYGNTINSVGISGDEFNVSYNVDTGLRISSANGYLKNKTYKETVVFKTRDGECTADISIVVKNTSPTVTIAQKDKFNLFYKDSEANLVFTSKGNFIEYVKLTDEGTSNYNKTFKAKGTSVVDDKGVATLKLQFADTVNPKSQYDANGKPVTKIKVAIKLRGYTEIVKEYNVATVTTKPSISASRAQTTFYTLDPSPYTSLALLLKVKKNGEANPEHYVDATNVSFKSGSEGFASSTVVSGAAIKFNPIVNATQKGFGKNNAASASVSLEVKEANWMEPIYVSHKFVVKYANEPVPTATVKINNSENPSITLNKTEKIDQVILSATISVMGYEFADSPFAVVSGNDEGYFNLAFDKSTGNFAVSIAESKRSTIANGKYKVVISTKVKTPEGRDVTVKNNTITITVKSSALASGATTSIVPTVSATGKFDMVRRDTGITYTLTALSNVNATGTVVSGSAIKLTGTDADKFEISTCDKNAKGQWYVVVTPKAGVSLYQNTTVNNKKVAKTYSYDIEYTVCKAKLDGTPDEAVSTTVVKKYTGLKVTQSAIKATATNTELYQANYGKHGKIVVKLSSPTDAKIEKLVQSTVSGAIPGEVARALSFDSVTYKADGTAEINYTVKNPAAMKVGTKYTVKYDATPAGNEPGVKPTTISFTIMMKK